LSLLKIKLAPRIHYIGRISVYVYVYIMRLLAVIWFDLQ